MRDQRIDKHVTDAGERRPRLQILDPNAKPLGIQLDRNRYRVLEGLDIDLRVDVGYLADLDAAELNRRAGRQTGDRFVEDKLIGLRIVRGRSESQIAIIEQGEDGILIGCQQDRTGGRRLEGYTADQNRENRLGLDLKSARRELQVDSARLPESSDGSDVLIVGRFNKDILTRRLCRSKASLGISPPLGEFFRIYQPPPIIATSALVRYRMPVSKEAPR